MSVTAPAGSHPPDDSGSPTHADGTSPPQATFRSAVGWSYALTVGRVGTTTLVMFVLAALLGPTEFGVLAMALLVLNLAQIMIQQGLAAAIVQREQLTDDHLDAAFLVMLLGGLAVGLAMAGLGPVWAAITGEPRLSVVCAALAPLVVVHALMIVPEAVLRRALRFRAVAVRTVGGLVAGGVVGIALAVAGAGIWALVAQQVITGVVSMVVVWVVCPWRPQRRPRLGAIRDLWRFSAHSASAGVAVFAARRADQLVASVLFGPAAVGIYRLATRLPEMLIDVAGRSLQQVALPGLSRLQNDRQALSTRLSHMQHLAAAVALPSLAVLAVAAGPLVELLGPQWDGTALPIQLLCLHGTVNAYGVVLGPALQAVGRPARLAALAWGEGVVKVVAFLAVGLLITTDVPAAQAATIAGAVVATQLMLVTVTIQVVRRTVGAKVRLLAPTLPAILAGLVGFGLGQLGGLPEAPPLVRLCIAAALAGCGAATVLWLTDRRARALVREYVHRRRAHGGPDAAAPSATTRE